MSKLWTFGDSFTAEYYPVGMWNWPSNYDKYKEWRGGDLPNVWSTLLGEKLGYDVMNMAIGGDSNYGIFNQFLNVCDKIKKDDIVIFGWANMSRFQVVNFDDGIFNQIVPCDNDFSHIGISKTTSDEIFYNRTHPLWATEVHSWIRFINLYLQTIGAKPYHWTSDIRLFDCYSTYVEDDKFIVVKLEHLYHHTIMAYLALPMHYEGNRMVATIDSETNGVVRDGHFGEFGHKCQAEYFYKHIMGLISDDEHKEFIKTTK